MTAPPQGLRLSDLASDIFLFLTSFRRSLGRDTFDIKWVRTRVNQLLAQAEKRSSSNGELYRLFQKAKYPLVVTIDGILLNSAWERASGWAALEVEHFNTSHGGERFFALVSDPEYADLQLQELLYTCLAIGFEGMYKNDMYQIDTIRKAIFNGLSDIPRERDEQITPDAYRMSPKDGMRSLPLVSVLRVSLVIVGVMVGLFLLSQITYGIRVKDLSAAAAKIAEADSAGNK